MTIADILRAMAESPYYAARKGELREAAATIEALKADNDTVTDDHGTVWTRPTAWAYMQACKALERTQDEREALKQAIIDNCDRETAKDLFKAAKPPSRETQ